MNSPLVNPYHPQYAAYQVALDDTPARTGPIDPISVIPVIIFVILLLLVVVIAIISSSAEEKEKQRKIAENPSWYDSDGQARPGTPAWDEQFRPLHEALNRRIEADRKR